MPRIALRIRVGLPREEPHYGCNNPEQDKGHTYRYEPLIGRHCVFYLLLKLLSKFGYDLFFHCGMRSRLVSICLSAAPVTISMAKGSVVKPSRSICAAYLE